MFHADEASPDHEIVVPALLEALDREVDGQNRGICAEALGYILSDELVDSRPPELKARIQSLDLQDRAVLKLIERIKDEDPDARDGVVHGLSLLGTAAILSLPALAECARSDPEPIVRRRAVEALKSIAPGDELSLQVLRRVIEEDPEMAVRGAAVKVLSRLPPHLVIQDLSWSLLHDPKAKLRAEAAAGIARWGREAKHGAGALQMAAFFDSSLSVRFAALEALRAINTP
jgi:HEAT repeat protein